MGAPSEVEDVESGVEAMHRVEEVLDATVQCTNLG
jgi:hypothetical protein